MGAPGAPLTAELSAVAKVVSASAIDASTAVVPAAMATGALPTVSDPTDAFPVTASMPDADTAGEVSVTCGVVIVTPPAASAIEVLPTVDVIPEALASIEVDPIVSFVSVWSTPWWRLRGLSD